MNDTNNYITQPLTAEGEAMYDGMALYSWEKEIGELAPVIMGVQMPMIMYRTKLLVRGVSRLVYMGENKWGIKRDAVLAGTSVTPMRYIFASASAALADYEATLSVKVQREKEMRDQEVKGVRDAIDSLLNKGV